MDQDELQSSVEEVRALNPQIDEVLLCSPFNKHLNFGGRLTAELFFEKLFIETEQVKALKKQLNDALSSRLQNNRIVFLEGYSGTGKTTFIQYFLKDNRQFESVYIDFYPKGQSSAPYVRYIKNLSETQSKLRDLESQLRTEGDKLVVREAVQQLSLMGSVISEVNQISEQTHPIATVIRSHLTKPRNDITDFLYYLDAHKEALQDYFERFAKSLAQIEPARDATNLHSLWEKTTLRDTFILFFLYYIQRYEKDTNPNRTYLVFFDNLDTIDLAYLTPFFKESFANALGLFSEMLQDRSLFPNRLDFEHRFKFIFCLRDANNSNINAHLGDTLTPIATNIHLRVGFASELYQSAFSARLKFHSEITNQDRSEPDPDEAKTIKMLAAFANDQFFTTIFVPLYNSDFRKLAHTLFQVTLRLLKADTNPGGLSFDDVGNSFAAHEDDKYGVRGALVFGIVQGLRNENFLKNYPFTQENAAGNSGYCLITRMLLTLLLNKSQLRRGEDVINVAKPFEEVPLGVIIQETQDLYRVDEIVQSLVDVFVFHRKSWVHLITFRNRLVESIDAFRPELDELIHATHLPATFFDVFITLNPSGYSFVKNVLVHFEFYSALAGNTSALFTQGLKRVENKPQVFEFEETINRVQRLVRKHSESMRTFLETKFEKGREMSQEDYLKSDFTFKHFKHLAPADEGMFHASRVASQHIAYVDCFRLWLLNQQIDNETKLVIDKKLIAVLGRYLDILTPWRDGMLSAREDIRKNIENYKYKYDGTPARINPKH